VGIMPAPHHRLTQPVLHVVWHIGGQGDMGQICPALHAALSPHGMGSPTSSIAGPQLRSGVLWLYATTQNGPAHSGNVFAQDCVNPLPTSKALQVVTHIQ